MSPVTQLASCPHTKHHLVALDNSGWTPRSPLASPHSFACPEGCLRVDVVIGAQGAAPLSCGCLFGPLGLGRASSASSRV